MKTYLSVSELANMFNLNRQTLHFYDKKDLFVPEYRDEETGYRKYSFEQVANLALICYLRKLDFSIDNIKTFMDLENIDLLVQQLKGKSEILKNQYLEILKVDSIIQRKISFVENELKNIEIGKIEVKNCPKRAYLSLGKEDVLYNNETFYYFPTIAFYNYNTEETRHNVVFGAYIEPEVSLNEEYSENIKYIEEQKFLCFYHKGPYEEISDKILDIKEQHKELNISINSICFNIVDQFLRKDTNEFITEVQIPILE